MLRHTHDHFRKNVVAFHFQFFKGLACIICKIIPDASAGVPFKFIIEIQVHATPLLQVKRLLVTVLAVKQKLAPVKPVPCPEVPCINKFRIIFVLPVHIIVDTEITAAICIDRYTGLDATLVNGNSLYHIVLCKPAIGIQSHIQVFLRVIKIIIDRKILALCRNQVGISLINNIRISIISHGYQVLISR